MTPPSDVLAACRAACAAQGTAQCAAICLTHTATFTRNGQCPEALRVWGDKMDRFIKAASAQGYVLVRRGALADIATERKRQVEQEGWTECHDDEHGNAQLAQAAAAYAYHSAASTYSDPETQERVAERAELLWPWAQRWWKPRDARRNLVKAGALILAEIERLDRAAAIRNRPETQG